MNTLPTKTLTVFGSVLLIGGIAVGGAAAPAFAHTPEVTADCDSLSMDFRSYAVVAAQPAGGGKPAVAADATPNTVTVTIDGVASAPVKFGRAYASTIALDGLKAHTYSVVLDTHDGYDRTFADKTAACPTTPPTTPAPSKPPVTPPTTPTPSEPPVTPTPTPSEPPVTPTPTPSEPPVIETPAPVVPPVTEPPVTETPAPIVPTVTEPPAPIVPEVPTATATATPAVVTAPTPTASTTELAETGVSTWSVPAVAASVLAMLLGAGLLLARRFRRA